MDIGNTTWWGVSLATLFYLVGFLHILHAVMHNRSSQGTIAWVVSLMFMPFLAIPCYWLFGRDKFSGYVRARRGNDTELRKIAKNMHDSLAEFAIDLPQEDIFERLAEELGGLPFTSGNHLEPLINGQQTFNRLFNSLENAKQYICVNFFIIKNDNVGMKFQKTLIDKARSGVRVYFLFDEIGSYKLSRTYLSELEDAGVVCQPFGTNRHWWSRLQINFRNHRKIVVIDGHEAFLGGLNVGDEYLGLSKKFGAWRDTHLRISGPAVLSTQLVFLEDWFWASSDIPELSWKTELAPENQTAAIIPTGPADPHDSWEILVIEAANSARQRLWITSPYFVPGEAVLTALKLAAMRQVDVRIMLPNRPDHLLVWLSAFSYYEESIPFGIKLFRFQDGFLHQKVMLIDDRIATIGTANFDNRSFRLNFEITAFCSDQTFIRQIHEMLESDFSKSTEVMTTDFTSKPFIFRAACRAARLASPLQ